MYPAIGLDGESVELLQRPEFLIWIFLIAAQTALFTIVIPLLLQSIRRIYPYSGGGWKGIAVSCFILLVLYLLPATVAGVYVSHINWPLFGLPTKINIIILLAALPALLSIVVVSSVYAAVRETTKDLVPSKELLQLYLDLRVRLQQSLFIFGGMIGLATLATAALRELRIVVDPVDGPYPVMLVLAYGAYFTVLIAMMYGPAYAALFTLGGKLRDVVAPIPEPDSPSWTDLYLKRRHVEDLLQLRAATQQNLETGLAILAPVLSGVVSVILD